MAKKTIEKFFSDISGKEIEEGSPTVRFSLGSSSYEIDLTTTERKEFESALSPYIDAGRSAGSSRRRARGGSGGRDPKAVRAWARDQGMEVPSRGRIPGAVAEAYDAAH